MKCFSINLNSIIKVILLNKEHHIPPKKHITRVTSEYIVYAITEGELWLCHSGIERCLVPGDIFIMKKGEYQYATKTSDCSYIYLHFEIDNFEELDISSRKYFDIVSENKKIFHSQNLYSPNGYDYIKALLCEYIHIDDESRFNYITSILENHALSYETGSPMHRLKQSAAIAEVFLLIENITLDQFKSEVGKNKKGYLTVDKIEEFIRKNYTKDITAAQIESLFFINYDYANRMFKKQFGCTLVKYKNLLRINYAKEKIRVSDIPLGEISEEIGFSDISYFSRVFKKLEGISPDRYRELLKGDK